MVAACWLHTGCGLLTFRVSLLAVHTMDELRMTGNCLRGSRPILSFDSNFDTQPHLKVMKEMFCHVRRAVGWLFRQRSPSRLRGHATQTFGTPRGHPKSQPFNDHIMSFYYLDGKIWVRHYQVRWRVDNVVRLRVSLPRCWRVAQIADVATDKTTKSRVLRAGEEPTVLVEIGPR